MNGQSCLALQSRLGWSHVQSHARETRVLQEVLPLGLRIVRVQGWKAWEWFVFRVFREASHILELRHGCNSHTFDCARGSGRRVSES